MKKKLLLLGAVLSLTFVMSMGVHAADETVEFTADTKLSYQNPDGELSTVFNGMAPGEEREMVIEIVNNNKLTADFYVATEALQKLEEEKKSSGGIYDVKLELKNMGGTVLNTLYDSNLGGTTGDETSGYAQNENGIMDLNGALADQTLLTSLKKGEKAQLVMTLSLDGETIRNDTNIADYTKALGEIGMEFMVAYDEPDREVIVRHEDEVIYETGSRKQAIVTTVKNVVVAVKTGDTTVIIPIVALLAAGLLLLAVTGKKKKGNGEVS